MIQLVDHSIEVGHLVDQARSSAVGAVVAFLGITRQFTAGRETAELQYDAYRDMAELELKKLESEARKRWPIVECQIVHRLGTVPLADVSVAIVVSSPHRRDAFEAGQWLIDTLKQRVPIWKKECWVDGTSQWVHPVVAR